ncbi:MAG: hypothetical protein J5777_06825 [Clostridiales bacterium]|nr:hypothetical protein [Clostridiales bacterium]
MNKRIPAVLMASSMLFSFASCSLTGGSNKPAASTEITTTEEETTVSETTTEEETTTTSEETTTTAEATVSEEVTVSEESTTGTTAAAKPTATPKPAKKPSSIPKGWQKVKAAYGKKYNGKYVYVIMKNYQYKGWYNGKWIKLYDDTYTVADDENGHIEGVILYRDKNEKYKYCEFQERR